MLAWCVGNAASSTVRRLSRLREVEEYDDRWIAHRSVMAGEGRSAGMAIGRISILAILGIAGPSAVRPCNGLDRLLVQGDSSRRGVERRGDEVPVARVERRTFRAGLAAAEERKWHTGPDFLDAAASGAAGASLLDHLGRESRHLRAGGPTRGRRAGRLVCTRSPMVTRTRGAFESHGTRDVAWRACRVAARHGFMT